MAVGACASNAGRPGREAIIARCPGRRQFGHPFDSDLLTNAATLPPRPPDIPVRFAVAQIRQLVERVPAAVCGGDAAAFAETRARSDAPDRFASAHRCAAFTLVETVIALAIAALLAAMAVPAFHEWLSDYQLANVAKHLAETMTRARTEAVRRGHRVNLCKSIDRRRCADHGGWDAGFVVFVDVNHNGVIDTDEQVLEAEGAAPRGISVSGNRPVDDYVSYTGLGQARMLNGALQMGTFVICRPGRRALHVVLANTGRVPVERTSERCA